MAGSFADVVIASLEADTGELIGTASVTVEPGPVAVAVDLPPGIVGWWPGNGNANDVAEGNHGKLLGGISFVPGKVGPAFSFDGVDDFVEISNTTTPDSPIGSFTVALWFKTESDINSNSALVTHYGPVKSPEFFHIGLSGTGGRRNSCQAIVGEIFNSYPNHVAIAIIDDSGSRIQLCSDIPMNDGQYHHVTASYDASTKTLTGYFDGQAGGFVSLSPQGKPDGDLIGPGKVQNMGIGAINWTRPLYLGNHLNRFFPFKLDELAIFNRALSGDEIEAIFDAGRAGMIKP